MLPQPAGAPPAASSPRTRTWWYLPALWLFVVVLPYPYLPAPAQAWIYLATSCLVVVALLAGLRISRPAAPAPWYLMTAAFSFFLVGDTLTYVHLDADGWPIGPWSDLAYLAFYPLVMAALLMLLRRSVARDVSAWVDAVIWTLGAGVLVWEWVVEGSSLVDSPTFRDAIAAAYPLMDLLVFLVLLRLLLGSIRGNPALVLLATALAAQFVTDIAYLAGVLDDTYTGGGVLDVGWLFSYTAAAAAALHPSMATTSRRPVHRTEPRLGGWRIPLLLVPGLVAPVTLAALVASGSVAGEVDDVAVATGATFVILILSAVRANGLVHLANGRADDLQVRVDHDSLTGLLSRDAFLERLEVAVDDPTAVRDPWAVIFLDLDDFKTVNDIQGHVAGDFLLVEVGGRLRSADPDSAALARFGGDEFAMLVRSREVEPMIGSILDAMKTPALIEGREVRLKVSIGSATATPDLSAVELMRYVDVAMYEAKRSDRSWSRYEPRMSVDLLASHDTRERLARGVDNGEVVPFFQPVVDLESGELHGFEALARWLAPGQLTTSTDQWLPLAEESDLIVSVDRQVMGAALRQLSLWRRRYGVSELSMAVNLSGRTLQQDGIEEEILAVLRETGVPNHLLVVEVTEGVQIEDDHDGHVGRRLQWLRAHGVRIALDDFGTGWSSLSYLRTFPVDELKLDRSFTAEVDTEVEATAIPAAVVQLAAALNLDIVAEGVETEMQRRALLGLGFHLAQGYLYSPAVPAVQLEGWIARFAAANPVVA